MSTHEPANYRDVLDVIVVGGGLAGGVAAWHLATRGYQVALLEKEIHPHHKVCGEFLSAEGLPILREIGVDPEKLGGVRIHKVHLHGPRRSVEVVLPNPAIGISRKSLDDVVLNEAERVGVRVFRGVHGRGIIEGLDGPNGVIRLDTSNGVMSCQRLIVATGKSEFRSVAKRIGRDSGFVGLKMHLRLKPSIYRKLENKCDVFVFQNGYGGLAPIEGSLANFCFLIEKNVLRSIGTRWDELASHISHHNYAASHYLDGAEPQFKNFLTVAHLPYGFLRHEAPDEGTYCIGDQMAVIPSLTGDGMSIALMTGRAVVESIADPSRFRALKPASTSALFQRQMVHSLRRQIDVAFKIHRIFSHPALSDWMVLLVQWFPVVFDVIFKQTRCQLSETLKMQGAKVDQPSSLDTRHDLRPS